jgi:peptidyl-prolyl cis-trans isomerase D
MWVAGGSFMLTIVFAWGMDFQGGGATSTLGKINGRKITVQEYQSALQQNYQYQRSQLGGIELDDNMVQFIQEQTWQQMVNEILIVQELQDLGMQVSDAELLFVIRNNPPAELRQFPDFQTDGIFDIQKYQAAMGNEAFRGLWVAVEDQLRAVIPQQKLEHLVASTALVTDGEAREAYRYRNEQVSAEFVSLTPGTHPDSTLTVSDAEIRDYYDGHRDEFTQPARVDLNYVLLYQNPSDRDLAEVRETLVDLQSRLAGDSDFGVLARQYSEGPSAPDGGSLGWINRGDMVETFDEKAFELEAGEISEPVRTQYGWHIVKVDSIRDAGSDDEQRKVRHILLEETATGATLDSLRSVLETLRLNAEESDFTTAATQLGLQVGTTGPVARESFIPGIGFEPSVTQYGFASRIGDISDVMEHTSAFYVVQVRDKLDAGISPLEDVRQRITDQLLEEKTINGLGVLADRLASQMQASPDRFDEIGEAEGLIVEETGSFTRNDFVGGVGRDPDFIAAAFVTPIGTVSHPVRGENGWYIIRVQEHVEVSDANIQSLVDAEKARILTERRRSAFGLWIQSLRSKARITDNRDKFFF